ncbi:hypothetical protein [Bifidobacterium asteroides]|uniref:hypothetical protein n=1 Tax=Bifidobacterium asteroides TaxID=1684 RepID=UPI0019505628|nr:hypothetical protein [Bifidobacterium asteroides]
MTIGILVMVFGITRTSMAIIITGSGIMLWGHYWSSESGMTIASLVAKPAYRGAASGIAYVFVKLASFLTLWVFPTLYDRLGVPKATLLIAISVLWWPSWPRSSFCPRPSVTRSMRRPYSRQKPRRPDLKTDSLIGTLCL